MTSNIVIANGMAMVQQFLPIILIIVIFYFLLIRPQQKQQKELRERQNNLKDGDKIAFELKVPNTLEISGEGTEKKGVVNVDYVV